MKTGVRGESESNKNKQIIKVTRREATPGPKQNTDDAKKWLEQKLQGIVSPSRITKTGLRKAPGKQGGSRRGRSHDLRVVDQIARVLKILRLTRKPENKSKLHALKNHIRHEYEICKYRKPKGDANPLSPVVRTIFDMENGSNREIYAGVLAFALAKGLNSKALSEKYDNKGEGKASEQSLSLKAMARQGSRLRKKKSIEKILALYAVDWNR